MKADTPSEARAVILDAAARRLADAVEDLVAGLKWLDLLEPGTLDRGREAVRVVGDFADHASELVEIQASPIGVPR